MEIDTTSEATRCAAVVAMPDIFEVPFVAGGVISSTVRPSVSLLVVQAKDCVLQDVPFADHRVLLASSIARAHHSIVVTSCKEITARIAYHAALDC